MKYLKTLIFAFIILQTTLTFSQQILGCDDEPTIDEQSYESIYTNALSRNTQNTNKYVFNMFFHIIRNDNGDAVPTNENTTLEAIAMLNRTYNQYDIYFKYLGFDYLDDSDFTDVTSTEFYNDLNNTSQARSDAFNVYIAQTVNGGNNAGKGRFNNTFSVFDDDYFLTASLPHEIAHNFYVLHTHQNSTNSGCEHVNRDNCLTNGDKVCDTEASYLFTMNNVQNNGTDQYEYVNPNNDTDCIGDIYVNVPIRNFMSRNLLYVNNYYNNLRNHFTLGQADRMKIYIENNSNNHFSDAQTTFSSLYEPYKSEYVTTIADEVYSLTDNGDGTAEECRWRDASYFNYFQPGFDYNFGFTSDLDVSFSKEQLPFIVDEGRFRAVKIIQIDPSFLDENNFDVDNYDYLTDIPAGIIKYSNAYHNSWGACETVPFLRAKIITKEYLGSPYSQLQELNNQQEASNPNLEHNLENNKFHIIEKTTTTGNKIQKTIYKNGN